MTISDFWVFSDFYSEIMFLRDEDAFKSSFCTEFFTAQIAD